MCNLSLSPPIHPNTYSIPPPPPPHTQEDRLDVTCSAPAEGEMSDLWQCVSRPRYTVPFQHSSCPPSCKPARHFHIANHVTLTSQSPLHSLLYTTVFYKWAVTHTVTHYLIYTEVSNLRYMGSNSTHLYSAERRVNLAVSFIYNKHLIK